MGSVTKQLSLRSLKKARSTLEDFAKSYLMFHDLEVDSFFQYLPILVFVEATLYQVDEHNEAKEPGVIASTELDVLLQCLQEEGLLDERIQRELQDGCEYWQLERDFCMGGRAPDLETVKRAIRLKSFDYRVLNLLMYRLTKRPYDETVLAFLAASELTIEIGDDLYDYEDDVMANAFNVYRLFIALYGSDAPTHLAGFISDAEREYDLLLRQLPPALQEKYTRRCKEAMGSRGGHWTLPPPILDEDTFRCDVAAAEVAEGVPMRE